MEIDVILLRVYTDRTEKQEDKKMAEFEVGSRRATDKVSTDTSLELITTLAYEYALKNDEVDILEVEKAIIACRQLKIEATGGHRILEIDSENDQNDS